MLAENLTVTGLTNARGTSHDDVRFFSCHDQCGNHGIVTSKKQEASSAPWLSPAEAIPEALLRPLPSGPVKDRPLSFSFMCTIAPLTSDVSSDVSKDRAMRS